MEEALLSSFLEVLFDRLASREVVDFIRGRRLDDRPLRKLKIILPTINAVLNDAEEKQISNPAVREWLIELKDAIYHAEDLVDEIATEALRCKMEAAARSSSNSKQVWNIISNSLNLLNESVESKIEKITDKLEYIANQKDILGLKEGVRGKEKASHRLPTTSLVNESCVFGRDIDKEKIIEFILSNKPGDTNDTDISVVPVVGMGGIGKTTLAQLVYNDERVREHFDLKAWVCITKELDVSGITKSLLESITLSSCDFKDLNLLQVRLKESLAGKRFLIVLDDVWNENYNDWDTLRSPFRVGEQGSTIIVTTRHGSVASVMQTVHAHHLQLLSYEDCWSLFVKHAFGNGNSSAHPNLEIIGREMVKKCKGLPLAAKTLGGLVRFKVCDSEWEDVLNSDIWDLPDEKSDILSFLRLSYHYLPAHLKRCFAYCSIFPKGFKFDRDRLVLLWMAEGLVQQPRRKKRMEEVGEDYFKDLLSRSFFQQCSSDAHFIMHDLINDLAQFVSGEFCFRLEDHKQKEISSRIRHLSYTRSEYDAVNKFEAFKAIKFLRTFMPLNLPHNVQVCHLTSQVPHYLLPALQCLRVLSLSHYGITELPDSIGDLKFLRYMDLSYTGVKELPKSATTLYNLQTLILLQCHSLTKLPTDFENLTNLHYFDITGSELTMMPGQIGRLKSLEKLPTFIVGTNSGSAMKELGKLLLLRGTLSIEGLQNVIDVRDAKEANLKDKKFIDELTLEWSSKIDGPRNGTVEDNVLDKLQPHKNLKRIDIRNYGGSRFPKWLGDHSFSKMASVSLKSLKNCISLPPLGNLPFLKNLSIEEMNGVKSVGPEFYGDASSLVKPFQSLETLRFENMPQWAEWMTSQVIEDDGFPCLQELYLRRCPILRGQLPISCPSLTKLVIYECTELDSPLPRFPSLKILEIHGCGQGVMTTARSFTSLSSLHINKISDLACVPESFLQQFTAMEDLSIGGCSEITSLSNRIGFQHLTSLNQLEIYGCLKLMNLPNELHSLPCLVHMRIEGCPSLLSLQEMGLPSTLKHLTIEECRALKSLPEGLLHNGDLEHLCIRYCSSLTSFPRGLVPSRGSTSTTTKLKSLMIEECENLLSLPDGIHNLTSLQELRLYECPRVLTFPEGGFPTKLRSLWIESCDDLMCLPMLMHNLSSLQELYIKGCPSITVFPDGGLPSSVESLQIVHCENLMRCIGMELEGLTSLRSFSIRGCRGVTSFPGDWVLPATLTSLCISKLPDLRAMSEGLQHLTSLEKLKIRECQELMSLPNRKLPDSLSFLEIWKCPRLDQRCLMEKGEDWPKIAHIPCIKSNYNVIL